MKVLIIHPYIISSYYLYMTILLSLLSAQKINTRRHHNCRSYQTRMIFSVFTIIIFASSISSIQVLAQEQFLTYEDITTGISIQLPSSWEKSVNLDNFITFRAPPETDTRIYPAALGLKIQELTSKSVVLQEVTKIQI